MTSRLNRGGCLVGMLLAVTPFSWAQLAVTPAHPEGVFQEGEPVAWKVTLKPPLPDPLPQARYRILRDGGDELRKGSVALTAAGVELAILPERPGSLILEVEAGGGEAPKHTAQGGALVRPAEIPRSSPRPDDFDEFWEAQLAELAKTPPNPVLTDGSKERPGILHSYLTMDLPKGAKLRAQIARPEQGEKLPALVIFQYAGVYPLPPGNVISRAAEGWLVLNVNAHDLPLNEDPEFYIKQNEGPLRNYPAIGSDDRQTSYFLRMFLASSRAVDYLASRRDWDGRTLVATGNSQGGLQAIVAAALNPKVSAVMVKVPAGCDNTAPLAERSMPWPYWLGDHPGKDREALVRASTYFDAVNFAPRVKCPALVAFGLLDRTATASGIQLMINQLAGPVEPVVMPASEHKEKHRSQAAFQQRSEAWLESMKAGAPPIPAP